MNQLRRTRALQQTGQQQTCSVCGGTGRVKINTKQVACQACRGTGKAIGSYATK
jgi:DnaJ-class molecular chaperone